MPEISFLLFDLKHIFLLFKKQNCKIENKMKEYQQKLEEDMAKNRGLLFGI